MTNTKISGSHVYFIHEKSAAGGEKCQPFCWQADTARVGVSAVDLAWRGNVDSGKGRAHLGADEFGHRVVVALDDDVA